MRPPHVLLALAPLLSGCTCAEERPLEAPAVDPLEATPADAPAPIEAPPTVVVVVIDTLRADHVSACGAPWPLTPTLDALAARSDAVLACDGWSSGTWTHPSHASLFTGRPVHEHGALWAREGGAALNPVTRVHPLPDSATTLAERFAAAGYQTALVSANPILTPESGLQQGFSTVRVARGVSEFRGEGIARPLLGLLSEADRDRPMLLFVNLYDAHDPYPAVPEGQPWSPSQPAVDLKPNTDADTPYRRFLQGTHEAPEGFLRTLAAGYAQGVHDADANLGLLMTALHRFRDLDAGLRLVVTSDHGELLGEHGLLRHGGFLWEPGLRIPALWLERGGRPADLPTPFVLHGLTSVIATGKVSSPEVIAASEPNPEDLRVGELGAARRLGPAGRTKHLCRVGVVLSHDLVDDPGEIAGTTAEDPVLDEACAAVRRAYQRPGEPVTEALRAVGYVGDDPSEASSKDGP